MRDYIKVLIIIPKNNDIYTSANVLLNIVSYTFLIENRSEMYNPYNRLKQFVG